jgi:integrase
MSGFQSIFAKYLADYVKLRRRIGLRFEKQEAMLKAFDRYVYECDYRGPLTEELALAFATSVSEQSTTLAARRYGVVCQFTEYLATFEPSTPRLDPKAIRRARQQPVPHVFTEEELEQLLCQATKFKNRHPVSNRAMHAMIGLAVSSGLRLREVLALDLSDVDLETGVLIIRHSKFDKDRLVPVHATTLDVLRAYAAIREQMPGSTDETAFFLNTRGHRFKSYNVVYLFRQLVRRINLHPSRGKPPTFSSLRHTFAVRRLVAWYRAAMDVQALLPVLATYMGHVHYTSTSYYLTSTAELLGIAAERLGAVTHAEEE